MIGSSRQMEISQLDKRILRIVQTNAQLTKAEIAEATNTSASSCWRRLQHLEQSGVIKGYEARLDPEMVGLAFSAIALVSLHRHEVGEVEKFTTAVRTRPEVLEAMAITGDADFMLRIVTRDIAHYNDFLKQFIFRQSCVVKVTTNVVMELVKDTTQLPIS